MNAGETLCFHKTKHICIANSKAFKTLLEFILIYENKAVLSVKMNIVGTVIDQCNNKITEEFTLCFTVCRVKIFIMIDVQDHFTSFRTYMNKGEKIIKEIEN